MFPHQEKHSLFDDYGEVTNEKDFLNEPMIVDENGVVSGKDVIVWFTCRKLNDHKAIELWIGKNLKKFLPSAFLIL